jgi:hypothetical protein
VKIPIGNKEVQPSDGDFSGESPPNNKTARRNWQAVLLFADSAQD